MSDVLGQYLSDIGYGGAETGADIVRMMGVQDPTVARLSAMELDPLFATVRKGLGELPELLATLTGQTQRRFQAGRAGVQQRGVELGRAGRAATARAGFAGGGAIQRRQQFGRRQLGQQFMGILGARETGLFGAEQRVAGERAGLLGQMGGGIQNLLSALISEKVRFGAGDAGTQIDVTPVTGGDAGVEPGLGINPLMSFREWQSEMEESDPASISGYSWTERMAKYNEYKRWWEGMR